MKRFFCVATAATVALSSFTTLVSAAPLRAYGVPDNDSAEVKLDIKTKWSGSDYADHETVAKAKSVSKGATESFDSVATLDMTEVAKKWHEFVTSQYAAAYETRNGHEALVDAVTLTGEYTIVIDADSVISNNGKDTVLTWVTNEKGYNVNDFFEQKGDAVFDAAANTLTVTMKVKDSVNHNLDAYFTALYNASDASEDTTPYDYILNIDNSKFNANSSGTYSVKGTFNGYVDIKLGGNMVSHVVFGDTTDIEYMRVATSGGGGGGGSRATATPAPTATTAPDVDTPTEAPTATPMPNPQNEGNSKGAKLNYDDHYAYIIGYPLEADQTIPAVRPLANITRAEVATIFFRLLTDESRAKFWTKDNNFSDVKLEDWFNNAISTAANAGIIEGYSGKFRPNEAITRAELATIAARFSSVKYNGEDKFSDISGHWAANDINKASETGWINGYEDGTFKPDQAISRAEAMTLINRLLYRLVENRSLTEDMVIWRDNMDKNEWYYANVQEATNSHHYDRVAIGYVETWTEKRDPRDWEALEKTYSEVTDAGSEESVFDTSGLDELTDTLNDAEAAE